MQPPQTLRRSDRLANKPATGTMLSQAQRAVCRRLGEEFDEPAADPMSLLTRYMDCFSDKILTSDQIKALIDLVLSATAGRGVAAGV